MDPACETLVEAIMRLCDPKLLDAVARAEASQSDALLLERELPRLQPKPQDQANRPTVDKCDFLAAWGLLLADFAGQIDGRKVFLRGVPFSPIAKTVVETIPNAWATQMSIYPGSAVVEAAGLRFVSVRVSYQEPLAADAKLPLAQAITRWSSADLVKAVMEAEQRYIPHHLNEFYRQAGGVRRRLLRDAEVQQPGKDNWMGRPSYEWLTVAWMDLEADFRERLASSIFLDGVKIEPEPEVESRPIPQAWASAAKIEVSNGTVTLGKMRYSGVKASLKPQEQEQETATLGDAAAATCNVSPTELPPITEANMRSLTDEELLLLLEEHGRRVVQTSAMPLIQPSRVSFGPILIKRMQWNADQGLLASTFAGECAILVAWLRSKIEHHQIPTKRGVEEPLREEYRRLKAGSTP